MPVPTVHLGDVRTRGAAFNAWERTRHSKPVHWAVECFAEALGVWMYTFFDKSLSSIQSHSESLPLVVRVGATAPFILGNIAELPNIGCL